MMWERAQERCVPGQALQCIDTSDHFMILIEAFEADNSIATVLCTILALVIVTMSASRGCLTAKL